MVGFWGWNWAGFMYGKGNYPTALTTGIYGPQVFTVGYVQKAFPQIWVSKGTSSISDIEIDLDVGSLINMTIYFKKESIFENTTFPMYARARVYDMEGKLVAEDEWDVMSSRFIPAGVSVIYWDLVGFGGGFQGTSKPTTWRPSTWGFGCRECRGALFQPSYGIPAGTYTIELDFIPLDFDSPISWRNCLLCGEYGNPDRPAYYPYNHLGPYEQRAVVTVTVTDSGEVSPIFEVDLRGSVKGYALGYNWKGELRTLAWGKVFAGAAPDDGTLTAYPFGGFFDMYLPTGTHSLKVEYNGMTSAEYEVAVTEGSDLMGIWFEMEQTGVPIPEFPVVGLVLVASLAASIFVLSRVRRKEE
jgi:hypothetical protein